jgi:hypothetical protein
MSPNFARGQCSPAELAKLTASDAAAHDGFGYKVAVSGNTVAASTFHVPLSGTDRGAVYIFVRSGGVWTEQAKLTASDTVTGDDFGFSLAMSGNTLVVGSPRAAYIFVRTGGVWTEQAKLTAPDTTANIGFGWSVAISGHTVVVGAISDGAAGDFAYSAYVFVRKGEGWTWQAKLTASDAGADDAFGWSVAVSGEKALVGAALDDGEIAFHAGSAYVFARTGEGWTEQAKLTDSDPGAFDSFGWSVAITGDTALVGDLFDDNPGETSEGSVHVFTRSGGLWTEQAKLTASNGVGQIRFGDSVALVGDTALIGALSTIAGSAYVFTRSGGVWTQQAELTASDASINAGFGVSVGLSGDTAVVGALRDDPGVATDAGSAYVFSLGCE